MIGDIELDPEAMPHMEVVTNRIILRGSDGLGDVKFMAGSGVPRLASHALRPDG